MPQLLALVFLLSSTFASAEIVLWKARGSITSGTGTFQTADFTEGTEADFRITYDDQAIQQITTNVLGRVEGDYRSNIALKIIITVGTSVWEGSVQSAGTGSPTTFFTRTTVFGSQESVELNVASSDNGLFPEFPLQSTDGPSIISLTFNSSSIEFLGSGISATAIRPDLLASATATISTGQNPDQLAFTIDPATFEVLNESDEITSLNPLLVSAEFADNQITLSWFSDFRFRYRVDSSPDLSSDSWTEVETRNGTQTVTSRSYPKSSDQLFYRVVPIERDL